MTDIGSMTDRELALAIRELDELLAMMGPADSPYTDTEIRDATTRYLDMFTEFVKRMVLRKRIGML